MHISVDTFIAVHISYLCCSLKIYAEGIDHEIHSTLQIILNTREFNIPSELHLLQPGVKMLINHLVIA